MVWRKPARPSAVPIATASAACAHGSPSTPAPKRSKKAAPSPKRRFTSTPKKQPRLWSAIGVELNRGAGGVEDLAQQLAQRQDFYAARLRQFAKEMETTSYPTEPERLSEIVALQAAVLVECVEHMTRESHAMLARIHEEIAQVNRRMADIELTDPTTGLMNRNEMERRIREKKSQGNLPPLLRFDIGVELPGDDLPNDIVKQVATRLGSQFRHNDLICRWAGRQFLVMFQGVPETAAARAEQILPWIAGRYLRDSGGKVEVAAQVHLVGLEILDAAEAVPPSPTFVL